ncbi:MAG: hypothetical protein HGA35_06800 [Erysipelotrichaceae bacterium]|nr:hypothetical protein [Erysipelotrichaceae bacterium]
MEIKLYYNSSDNRCVQKIIENELTIPGTLREDTSLVTPIVTINSQTILRYNYAYIPEFRRYYFINNKESVRNNLWRLYLEVDPLMSFKADILALKVVVDKQSLESNGDEYIDDGSLVTDNVMFKTVYNFSGGFN